MSAIEATVDGRGLFAPEMTLMATSAGYVNDDALLDEHALALRAWMDDPKAHAAVPPAKRPKGNGDNWGWVQLIDVTLDEQSLVGKLLLILGQDAIDGLDWQNGQRVRVDAEFVMNGALIVYPTS